jgi:3-carboxy-cis,cis-muconate cycloisomerase
MAGLTSAALNKALFLSEHLVVDEARMAENVRASKGLMLAEAVSFALSETMDRAEAKKIVAEACQVVLEQGRHLVEVVQERTQAPLDWQALKDERAYFGSSEVFIERVLAEAERVQEG